MAPALILADDLTGAADCALAFAGAGHRAEVLLDVPSSLPNAGVVSIDLDTRHRSAEEAAARTTAAFASLGGRGAPLYYKIDSTLRGPWAAAVAALHRVAGIALVAPAYPAQGRVVKGGHVHMGGQRLDETPLWRLARGRWPAGIAEALEQAGLRCAPIDAQALAAEPGRLAATMAEVALRGAQALACDAQDDQALDALATADGQLSFARFWVGSAGMAGAIARGLPAPPGPEPDLTPVRGPIVSVVGSLSDVSDRQCEALVRACPMRTILVDPELLRRRSGEGWTALQRQLDGALSSGADVLVRIAHGNAGVQVPDGALATHLAELLRPHAPRVGAWILTGGETARGILAVCGIDRLQVLEGVEPGIALTVGVGAGTAAPLVVTKAGAFGSDASLERAYRHIEGMKE